jgi:2-methylcitrate dehydratase PrpD
VTSPSGITRDLSHYIATAQDRKLPDDIVLYAKRHILDSFVAMLSGSVLPVGRFLTRLVHAEGGNSDSLLIGSSLLTTASLAALANGTLAHADETDDFHASSATHPGCSAIPAAFAVAEREHRDGAAFVKAVVLGYDIGCRVTRALVPRLVAARGHSTRSIGGTFCAAAGAASLLRLDATQTSYALSYAAQQASGVGSYIRDRDHMEKAFALGGMPARNGVTAALLVHAGFSGVEDVFQGERNFLQAYSSDPKPGELVAELGSRFEIRETSIKQFCAGSPIQAPLEALVEIMLSHKLEARDVQHLTVRLPEPNARTVDNRHMSDVNLQHILSVALLDGRLTFAAAHSSDRMHDARVLEVASRIQLVPDPDLVDDRFPRQAIVEIVTSSGQRLKQHVRAYRGESANPMTIEEVETKAQELIIPVVGKEKCSHLIAMVRDLEHVTDMRALRPALTAERAVNDKRER